MSEAPASVANTSPGSSGRAPSILIVDDSEDLVGAMKELLEHSGYRVDTAPNGAAALEKLGAGLPSVILLDMHMPVMDGWEFSRRFHERYGRSVPIVVMTVKEDSMLRADEVGADFYLGKPFDVNRLLEVVEDTAGAR